MCNLVLNVSDKVRNISRSSGYFGEVGHVTSMSSTHYRVAYDNGCHSRYTKELSHNSLEKVEEQPRQYTFNHNMEFGTAYRDACMRKKEDHETMLHALESIRGHKPETRKVLNKIRRNVITNWTQDEKVKELGHARGVQMFNTRALGLSTGQAMRIVGDAMCNPNTPVRITDIDHAISDGSMSTPRNQINTHFRNLIGSLICNMKGFHMDKTHITFNPIVTEETYVENKL